MSGAVDLSVVYVNYGTSKVLEESLAGLPSALEDVPNWEVVIVDNWRDMTERVRIRELGRRWNARLVEPAYNAGFGEANNVGVAVTRAEVVLLLNADTLPDPRMQASRILMRFAREPSIGLISPMLVDAADIPEFGQVTREVSLGAIALENLAGIRGTRPLARLLRAGRMNLTPNEAGEDVANVSAAALFVRRSAFRSVGGFDSRFFMYFEDVDLCRRMRASGWGVELEPRCRVVHLGGSSTMNTPGRRKSLYYESQQLYFELHRPRWETTVLRAGHRLIAATSRGVAGFKRLSRSR